MNMNMNDKDLTMYEDSIETDDNDLVQPSGMQFRLSDGALMTEVEINGRRFSIPKPQALAKMESMIQGMQKRIAVLEQDLRNIRQRMSNTEMSLYETKKELGTKISYE